MQDLHRQQQQKGVPSFLFSNFLRNLLIWTVLPSADASWPSLFFIVTSDNCSTKNWITLKWPWYDAKCNAVVPKCDTKSLFAPASGKATNNSLTTSILW